AREVATGHGSCDLGNVADLGRQGCAHRVDRVSQVLPRACYVRLFGAATELAFRADLACHAKHFRGERVELVDHRVDGVLQLEDLAPHGDRARAREGAAEHAGD